LLKESRLVVTPNRNSPPGDGDSAIADILDAAQGDDVGAVRADEFAGGEEADQAFHGHTDDERLFVIHVDLEVVVGGFDEQDVGGVNTDHAIVGLDQQGLPLVGALAEGEELGGFPRRLLESFQREGFEEVVDGVEVEALHGIFAVGGGEDHQRTGVQGLVELETALGGHADIEEEQVDGGGLQVMEGFGRTEEGLFEPDTFGAFAEVFNDPECGRFIVYGNGMDHMPDKFNKTVNVLRSSSITSECCPG
jgi:hypothetical protein